MFPFTLSTSAVEDQLLTTTPTVITSKISALCKEIAPHVEPIFVDVEVAPDAEANECFNNVATKIKVDGGSIQHGWTIWQFGDWMVEAEFHAVWRNPEGVLIDISPKPDGEAKILFLSDPKRVYQGAPRDNFRKPLVHNKLIDDYINLAKKFYVMRSSDKGGPVALDREKLIDFFACLELTKKMLQKGQSGDDRCACDSGKLYRNCHSKVAQAIRV